MATKFDTLFENVEDYIDEAKSVSWDGCHKIYLAMDDVEAAWFRENYDEYTFVGTPDEMLDTVRKWYDASCGLRFVQAVQHNIEDPNAGYTSLIDQFADVDDEDEDEEW